MATANSNTLSDTPPASVICMAHPDAFRGGKSAVRREAYRLLPERIRAFDPAGGEHFTQFVTVWLEANLNEFVAGNGRRRAKKN